MASKPSRLEWISLLYLVFFVLAILSPSLYTRGYFGLNETQLEELTIFFFGMAGLITFSVYERLMERREKEREHVETEYEHAKTELMDSYAYIGSINRKIELLKKMANDASFASMDRTRLPKELLASLAANACSAIGAESAIIRFVDLPRLRVEREIIHPAESSTIFRIANRDLRALHERGVSHDLIKQENGNHWLIIPSDRKHDRKAFLILLLKNAPTGDMDTSLLKVFVNQAEMLHGYLGQNGNEQSQAFPVLFEDQATPQADILSESDDNKTISSRTFV